MFNDEIPVGNARDLTDQVFGQLIALYRCKPPYTTQRAWWKCLCVCGKVVEAPSHHLTTGHKVSCGCYRPNVANLVGQRFGRLTVLELLNRETNAAGAKWKCLCDCGNTTIVTTKLLNNGHVASCGCLARKSKGEDLIKQILKTLDINFVSQFRFYECRSKNPLIFDFYLSDYNCCIEYDGKQHFEPIDFFGGEEQFKIQQKNDKIKTEYCKENDIRLIRIPYTDYDKLNEDYLLSFFRNIEC